MSGMTDRSSPRSARHTADEIAAAYVVLNEDELTDRCSECDGRGQRIYHDPECYDTGECSCGGETEPCETCGGTGDAS